MQKIKKNFILKIALSNTRSSAFQRANVYKKNIDEEEKALFVQEFKSKLRKLEEVYSKEVTEAKHLEFIQKFANQISSEFPHVLNRKKMKFGVAQKAVNLYLKFLWCLGYIQTQPLHCPIDRIVLTAVGINANWTELDSVNEYQHMIKKIREEAKRKNKTIAEWELSLWNNEA